MITNKIQAIKALRDRIPALGLKEAKDLVEMHDWDIDNIIANHIPKHLIPQEQLSTLLINRLLFKEDGMVINKKAIRKVSSLLGIHKDYYLEFDFSNLDNLTLLEIYTLFVRIYYQ